MAVNTIRYFRNIIKAHQGWIGRFGTQSNNLRVKVYHLHVFKHIF